MGCEPPFFFIRGTLAFIGGLRSLRLSGLLSRFAGCPLPRGRLRLQPLPYPGRLCRAGRTGLPFCTSFPRGCTRRRGRNCPRGGSLRLLGPARSGRFLSRFARSIRRGPAGGLRGGPRLAGGGRSGPVRTSSGGGRSPLPDGRGGGGATGGCGGAEG